MLLLKVHNTTGWPRKIYYWRQWILFVGEPPCMMIIFCVSFQVLVFILVKRTFQGHLLNRTSHPTHDC